MAKTRKQKKTCSVPGCDKKHYGKGLCNMHYTRLRLKGEVGSAKPLQERHDGCSVPGCERKHHAKGFCCMHYVRWITHGEVGKALPIIVRGRSDRLLSDCRKSVCNILKEHEEDLKDDPERLDRTFLAELIMIDCDWDKEIKLEGNTEE